MSGAPCDDVDCAIRGQAHPKCARHRKRREAGSKVPCGGHRIRGLDVCRMHAGTDGATARAKGERRLALDRAIGLVGQLADELGLVVSADAADSTATLLEAVARARQMARVCDELVAGLTDVAGPDHLGDLRTHPYVELQRHWNAEAAKVSKAALDAGISERQMQLAEAHVRTMAAAFRAFVVHLVDALVAAGADVELVRRVVGEQAPALMRKAIEAARSEEA